MLLGYIVRDGGIAVVSEVAPLELMKSHHDLIDALAACPKPTSATPIELLALLTPRPGRPA